MTPTDPESPTARAWQRNGPEIQVTKAAEECAEFSAAWLRYLAGGDIAEVLEEAADVIICTDYLHRYFADEIDAAIQRKLARLGEWLDAGGVF